MQSLVHAIFSMKKVIPVVYSSVHLCIAGLKIIGSLVHWTIKLVKKELFKQAILLTLQFAQMHHVHFQQFINLWIVPILR